MLIIIIILSILLCIMIFITLNLYRKVDKLENMVGDTENMAMNVYNVLLKTFVDAFAELQRVDKGGAFAADDEVGFTFRTIKEVIEQVKYQIEQLNKNSEDEIED